MSDTTNNSVTPNPSEDLGNPQSLVDAALSPAPVAPVVTEPLPPIVPPAFVAPTQPEPPVTPATPTPAVSMSDDTPLAFVASAPVALESTVSSELPNPVPPSPGDPQKKPRNKIGTLVAGLLLVVGMVGGVYGYNYYASTNDVSLLVDGGSGMGTLPGSGGGKPKSKDDKELTAGPANNQPIEIRNTGSDGCNPSQGKNGGCGANEACSCTNKTEMNAGFYTSCSCGPTGGQDPCFHTICPVNYSCQKSGTDAYCAPNPRPSAPAEESTPPQPSPSTVASMSCTGITSIPSINPAPIIGAKLVFTCDGTVTPSTAGTLSYKFRYSINNGAFTAMTNKTATTSELTIAACGSYKVQCQACATLNSVITCDPIWTGATQ